MVTLLDLMRVENMTPSGKSRGKGPVAERHLLAYKCSMAGLQKRSGPWEWRADDPELDQVLQFLREYKSGERCPSGWTQSSAVVVAPGTQRGQSSALALSEDSATALVVAPSVEEADEEAGQSRCSPWHGRDLHQIAASAGAFWLNVASSEEESATPEPALTGTSQEWRTRGKRLKRRREEVEEEVEYPPLAAESPSEPLELNAKLLALRQYIEERREATKREFKSAAHDWKLPIVRSRLVSNIFDHLSKLTNAAQLWRNTVVTFVGEAGIDQGGLTADMHSSFWREVLKPEHGLFEQLAEGGAHLPKADADPEQLALVGRFLLKSIIDDHPTGPGVSTFLLEFLSGAHETRAFRDTHPSYSLQLLANVDATVAQGWSTLLQTTDRNLEASFLTMDDFDDALPDEPLARTNVTRAVVAGCRRKLLSDRSVALAALRRGFTMGGKLDLGLQLAQHRNADLALLLQGRATISSAEMLDCFDWTEPPAGCAAAVEHLRTAIEEGDTHLDAPGRLLLLRFCTGLNALPVSGLTRKITFNLLDKTHAHLPDPHTCTHELDLPAYNSKAELLEKLLMVLDSFAVDPSFGQE